MADVFVYGTLTDPDRAAAVVGDYRFRGSAVLEGLQRVDGRYPTLAPGGSVTGRLLRTADLDALDAYEGVDSGLYVRVSVPRGAPESPESDGVEVYVGDPDRLGADASWPGTGPLERRVRSFLEENDVFVETVDE